MFMKFCIYCGREKPDEDFYDIEHIWPEVLGGDHLSEFWRTDDVCGECNRLSGLFVDGSFIKSWLGAAERALGSREYLSPEHPGSAVLPLHYIGVLPNAPTLEDEVAEQWFGPCGAHILHIRPRDKEDLWASYSGGDPRLRRSKAGRAYIARVSEEPFWMNVTFASFKAHFAKAQRFVLNQDVPPEWRSSPSVIWIRTMLRRPRI
jgi:HNH endonuclease